MTKKQIIERFEELRELYVKLRRVDSVEKIDNIIESIENDNITQKFFKKLDSRYKWELFKYMENKATWICGNCGDYTGKPYTVVDGELACSYCGLTLTRRTGGGMNDPFQWTFEWKEKELRRIKLKKIDEV